MRGAFIAILLASLAACAVTTTHQRSPSSAPTTAGPTEPGPTEPEEDALPPVRSEQVGVWESRPRVAGDDEPPERYVLASDGRFVWQAAHHAEPEARPGDAAEGYERFGRWGSAEEGIALREQRRLVSQLVFTECPGGDEQCECQDCACEACVDPGTAPGAEGSCPCAWESRQEMQQPPNDRTLSLGECAEDAAQSVLGEQDTEVEAPCHLLGQTPFWHYPDADEANLRVQDAWGSADLQ